MDARYFAEHQYRDYCVYKALAQGEPDADFRAMLQEMTRFEHEDFLFWRSLAKEHRYRASKFEIIFFKALRRMFGLIFTVKVLERRAKKILAHYRKYLARVTNAELRRRMETVVAHETYHEQVLIAQLKEDRVTFISNMVLGLNDGLVELTGALVGFSFALGDHLLVAVAGLITGISASLSMASSAFMQARYEENKDPRKAAFYTGLAYLIVVILLVMPFFVFKEGFLSLAGMFAIVFLIINAMSFYGTVILGRSFFRQAGELFVASIGVGTVAFIIGTLFHFFLGAAL